MLTVGPTIAQSATVGKLDAGRVVAKFAGSGESVFASMDASMDVVLY
jgi:hypothetical protein